MSTATPGVCLAVRGLNPHTTEEQLTELFRQYVHVKSAMVVRDRHTGIAKGLGFVEFHSIEHATYVLTTVEAAGIELNGHALKLSYARPAFMAAQITQVSCHYHSKWLSYMWLTCYYLSIDARNAS